MISGVHVEVALAAGYAVFLGGVAFLLEFLARHSHKRSERYGNFGFVYFQGMDLWECPAGRQLTRADVNYQRRIVYYRAPANACNACSLKHNCTDSNQGRVLESRLDSWVESELRRFHRGISLVLLVLATLILAAEAVRFDAPRDLFTVGCLLIPAGIALTTLCASFRARQQS
jgi:Transposase DDE domain